MEPWLTMTIPTMLDQAVVRRGDAEAVVIDGNRLTYRQLGEESKRIARRLLDLGVTRDSHVALIMENCMELVLLNFALTRIGAVMVPINFNFKEEELAFVLGHSDITHLIFVDSFMTYDYVSYLRNLTGGFPAAGNGELRTERLPLLQRAICLNRSGRDDVKQFEAMLDYHTVLGGDSPERAAELAACQARLTAEDICYHLYTSGSTGFPKSAQIIHRGVVGTAHNFSKNMEITAGDRVINYYTFYHVGGLEITLAAPLHAGACTYAWAVFNPETVLECIQRERITHVSLFDAHITKMLASPRFKEFDLSSLRAAMFAGPPNIYDVLKRDFGVPKIHPTYGSTESSGTAALVPAEVLDERIRKYTNGKPYPGVEIQIADPDTGKRLPPGQVGEIRVKSWGRFAGYYKMPEENAKAFDAEGYFCSGDMGFLDEAGYMTYQGRYKMVVKTGGENVSEIEVENFLCDRVPGIRSARVIGVPDPEWGEAVTAFIELEPGVEPMSLEAFREFCKQYIANYKVPRHVFYLQGSDWPVNPTGKVVKPELKKRAIALVAEQEAGKAGQ